MSNDDNYRDDNGHFRAFDVDPAWLEELHWAKAGTTGRRVMPAELP